MSITGSVEIRTDDLPGCPDEDWWKDYLRIDNERARQIVQSIGGQPEFAIVDCYLQHGSATTRANPLDVPVAGVFPIRAQQVITDSTGKITSQVSTISHPRIEWHPRTGVTDGSIQITAFYDDAVPLSGAGAYGESVKAFVAAPGVTLTNTIAKTVASITLSAGNWNIDLVPAFTATGATATRVIGAINTTTDSLSGTTIGDNRVDAPAASIGSSDVFPCIPGYKASPTSSTVYYFIARADFSAGTITAYGRISATRTAVVVGSPLGRVRLLFVGASQ